MIRKVLAVAVLIFVLSLVVDTVLVHKQTVEVSTVLQDSLSAARLRVKTADSLRDGLVVQLAAKDSALQVQIVRNKQQARADGVTVQRWRDSATVRDSAGRPFVSVDTASALIASLQAHMDSLQVQCLAVDATARKIIVVDSSGRKALEAQIIALAKDDSTLRKANADRLAHEHSLLGHVEAVARAVPIFALGALAGALAARAP